MGQAAAPSLKPGPRQATHARGRQSLLAAVACWLLLQVYMHNSAHNKLRRGPLTHPSPAGRHWASCTAQLCGAVSLTAHQPYSERRCVLRILVAFANTPPPEVLDPEAAAKAPWSRTGKIWQRPGCRGAPAGPAGDAALGLVPLQHCVGHSCECGGAEGRGLRPGPGKTQITKFLKNLRQNPHRESQRQSKAKSEEEEAREETEASAAGESHHLWGARRDVIRSSLSLEGIGTGPHPCTALHT